jgi:hypothetical protein
LDPNTKAGLSVDGEGRTRPEVCTDSSDDLPRFVKYFQSILEGANECGSAPLTTSESG